MTTPATPRDPADGAKAERRHLTVLFSDMVGSSALSAELDPEDLRQILRAFQACCVEAVQSFDGHIARYMGDGILAYFGFPAAHEDDAERAVQAALKMVRAVSALSFPGVPRVSVRIGIATGLVVVGDLIGQGASCEFDLIGKAPNLAARLQQIAQPDQILIGSATRQLLGQLFDLDDLGQHTLKGMADPVQIWSVLRPSRMASRFDARGSARLTPLIGRDVELARLNARFELAKQGQGQFVCIVGEPGIGKSRLITTFRRQAAAHGALPLVFQCSSYHSSSPWYPVIRHIEYALGLDHEASAALKLERLESFIDDLMPDQGPSVIPLLATIFGIAVDGRYPVLELTPHQQKRRTYDLMLALLRAQCERQPLIVICEDIHWIDHTSSEMLDLLRQSFANWRILLIASHRLEMPAPLGADETIHLGRLPPLQVASLIDALTDDQPLSARIVQQIITKADGIPLFVEEVTKTILADTRSEAAPRGLPRDRSVPDTLQDSLMARLDRLSSGKTIAQISAAIGREFPMELLAEVASMHPDELRRGVERLLQAGIFYRREQVVGEIYAFNHALVQDTAYASMLRDERRPLHRRIAQALMTDFSDVAEGAPEIIAYHYTQAGEIASAIHQWLKAGRRASARSAFTEAVTHFETAIALLPELPENSERAELELQLQQALANASIAAKGFGAAQTMRAFNRALELCQALDDSARMIFVLNGLVGVHMMRGEFEKARAVAEYLLALAQRKKERTALLMGHRVLGMALFVLGDFNAGKRELKAAIDLYDPAEHAALALALAQDLKATAQSYLGLTHVVVGDSRAGLSECREAVAYAEQLRHPHSLCYVLPFLAGALILAGDARAAFDIAQRAIVSSKEYGFPQWLAGGVMLRGWARIELGDPAAGLADIRDSMAGLEATGTLIWMQFARYLLARAMAADNQLLSARELIDQILIEIETTGGRWYEAEVHLLKADLLRQQGAPLEEVEASLGQALTTARRQGARVWERKLAATMEAGPSLAVAKQIETVSRTLG